MKTSILFPAIGAISYLGAAFGAFGQGYVNFSNYASTPYFAVVYNQVATLSLGTSQVSDNVVVELGYYLGNYTPYLSQFTLIPSSVTAINPILVAPNNGVGPPITGYFEGGEVTIPGYVSGPVTFLLLGWIASGPGAGDSYGTSAADGFLIWTEPSISTFPLPVAFTAMPGSLVVAALDPFPMPEPGTLKIFALAAISTWILHRRIAARRLKNG